VRSIALSVARFTWRHFSTENYSELQRRRINIRWADHISAEVTKPWAAEGVSRAPGIAGGVMRSPKPMGQHHDTRRHRQGRPVQRLRGKTRLTTHQTKHESNALPEQRESVHYSPPQLWTPQPGPQTDAIVAKWCPAGRGRRRQTPFPTGRFPYRTCPTYGQAWRASSASAPCPRP
jgi:hypothetical protein